MHRGVYAMGDEVIKLCEAQFEARQLTTAGKPCPPQVEAALDVGAARYVAYCMQFVQLMLDMGVRPFLVFDGASLPAKDGTDEDRFTYVRTTPTKRRLTFLRVVVAIP